MPADSGCLAIGIDGSLLSKPADLGCPAKQGPVAAISRTLLRLTCCCALSQHQNEAVVADFITWATNIGTDHCICREAMDEMVIAR